MPDPLAAIVAENGPLDVVEVVVVAEQSSIDVVCVPLQLPMNGHCGTRVATSLLGVPRGAPPANEAIVAVVDAFGERGSFAESAHAACANLCQGRHGSVEVEFNPLVLLNSAGARSMVAVANGISSAPVSVTLE